MNGQTVWNRCRVVPEDRDGHYESYTTTVSSVVVGGDDTDATAAIAGPISAIYNGASNVPRHLAENVEDTQRLQRSGQDIYRLANSLGNDHYDSTV